MGLLTYRFCRSLCSKLLETRFQRLSSQPLTLSPRLSGNLEGLLILLDLLLLYCALLKLLLTNALKSGRALGQYCVLCEDSPRKLEIIATRGLDRAFHWVFFVMVMLCSLLAAFLGPRL